MMYEQLEGFLIQIPNLGDQTPSSLIDYFLYFLTVIEKKRAATPAEVKLCFELSRLQKYSNIASYLSRYSKKTKSKPAKFIKTREGYSLERNREVELQKTLHAGPSRIETSHLLRGLLTKLVDPHERSFLQEAIDCYEIGARRGAIVLVWILTVHHLYQYILKHELTAFNVALGADKDKRIKITIVNKIDDFSEIPEGKFIELARVAKIISNDVRKILETKLGIRNSSAHPSAITISEVKATDFIIDLVENVIHKFIL
jgi:hypothetical protein